MYSGEGREEDKAARGIGSDRIASVSHRIARPIVSFRIVSHRIVGRKVMVGGGGWRWQGGEEGGPASA